MSRTKLAILRIFTWFHLFGVASLISATNNDALHRRPTGRVTLFSFERGNLRTVTDNVDTEVVLTMPPRYFEAYLFECNASYPVQWAYIGEAAPVVTADVGRFFQDFYDVNSYTYQSILIMYTLQELQSGRYICRGASKEYDKLAIHYDVYVPGNGSQILLSTSEKKLFVTESKEHAYIPCGVSDSTAVVNLYRGNQWGTFYPVPSNGSISFNPRKGFKIRFKDFLDPWGTYLCVAASNKKRRKVHLIPESVKAKYDLISHVNGKIPVYFSYEYEFNRILCCTGTNFIPKLQWAGCGSILDCQVKSACFEEDRCERRLGNSGYNPTKWIDPGPLPPGCSGYRLRDDPNGDFGLFKCSTPGIAQYQPYLLNRKNIFLDFEKTPPSEMILTLQRISPEGPSFVGDELEFHCNSTRFYFAYGIRWGWEKLNGEIEFIEDSTVVRDKYFVTGHRRRTTFKISHSNIKSIICFVPVVNSATEWRTVSLPVVIATNEANLISTQNNPPPPNVIDLDSITYRYDTSNPPVPSVQQAIPQPNQQQKTQRVDLQVYKSSKSPHEEFQPIQTSSIEHQDKSQYYNYAHGSSSEYPTTTHTNAHQPHSNSNPIIGAQQLIQHQPQIVDIYSPGIQQQASTPSPTTISISRSKKTRSRTSVVSSTSRSAPISKPDIHYDPTDRDYSTTLHDSFEPNPSSSITSNARLHSTTRHYQHHVNQQRMRAHPSPSRISSAAPTRKHATPVAPTKRPLSGSAINNNYNNRDEKYTSSNSNKEKDYADYHEHDNDQFGVDMRLSLPFDPALPSSNRGRHAHPHNYTSSRDIPSRKSNARTHATEGSRSNSNSRRPSYTRSQSSSPLTSTSSRHIYQNHPEKDYTIEDSYSQHVRLSLPSNAVGTQVPKSHQTGGRSRGRHHEEASHTGHGRARGRSHSNAGSSRQHRLQDYYIEDSPVEVKVPRPKAHHDAYISSSQIRHNSGSGSRDRHHHPHQQHHSHTSTSQQPKELHTASGTNDEPQHHESSPTTYLRRRPYADDVHSPRPTSQSYIYGDHVKPSSGKSTSSSSSTITSNRHEPQSHSPLPAPTIQYHKQVYQSDIHDEHYKSARRHRDRTRSRAMKFNAEASGDGIVVDAYELASPSSRPAYFFSPHQHQEQPNSNEIVRADMELKRLQPYRHTSSSRPAAVKGKSNNNSSDILHSVSISISSRVSHAYDDEDAPLADHVAPDEIAEKADNEAHESGDYDVYSPQHTNYKSSTTPSTFKLVPIQFYHVKPSEKSSFQPAKSVVDEDDDDEIG